jgi:hypothetical protein
VERSSSALSRALRIDRAPRSRAPLGLELRLDLLVSRKRSGDVIAWAEAGATSEETVGGDGVEETTEEKVGSGSF